MSGLLVAGVVVGSTAVVAPPSADPLVEVVDAGGVVAAVPAAGPGRASPQRPGAVAGPDRATALRIPAIGVRTGLVDLGVDAAGALLPPDTADAAGWFAGGAVPGEPGPAVIAGHVDSRAGPGVFVALGALSLGAEVDVDRSDGSTARFRVVAVERFDKQGFPTARVYGPTPVPALSLVTCGGEFDRARGHYRDNVVVTAVPIRP